jgi:hypothetical protein
VFNTITLVISFVILRLAHRYRSLNLHEMIPSILWRPVHVTENVLQLILLICFFKLNIGDFHNLRAVPNDIFASFEPPNMVTCC